MNRTKIVATIGLATSEREIILQIVQRGMNVARLNFSHGSYQNHSEIIALLRSISAELNTPITILQDLQGPKIRVGQLPEGGIELEIVAIEGKAVVCQVVEGGILKSRKGVNLPSLNLKLPSMTEKDQKDLEFGISVGID